LYTNNFSVYLQMAVIQKFEYFFNDLFDLITYAEVCFQHKNVLTINLCV